MKKQILNIGNALNKTEQKEIKGGRAEDPILDPCINSYISCIQGSPNDGCPQGQICQMFYHNNEAHGVSWGTHEWLCVCD